MINLMIMLTMIKLRMMTMTVLQATSLFLVVVWQVSNGVTPNALGHLLKG